LIETLEAGAKANMKGVLGLEAKAAAKNFPQNSTFLPNDVEFTKVVSDRVILIHPSLARARPGEYNRAFGWPLTDSTGITIRIGSMEIYPAEFSDETKALVTHDAILLNKKYLPEIDSDRALYNVLLALQGVRGQFEFEYSPAPMARDESPQNTGSDWSINDAYESLDMAYELFMELPEEARPSITNIGFFTMYRKTTRKLINEARKRALPFYNHMARCGLTQAEGWPKFFFEHVYYHFDSEWATTCKTIPSCLNFKKSWLTPAIRIGY
jgi:hypothetical protein